MPSFSLGLSQEDAPVVQHPANPLNYVSPPEPVHAEVIAHRRSKRPKVTSVVLQDYKCDSKVTGGISFFPDLDQRFEHLEQTLQNQS